MNYEVVTLTQKTVVGLTDKTSNTDPQMAQKIGKLWEQLFERQVNSISCINNKLNDRCIGLYCDYTPNGEYTVLAGAEVARPNNVDMVIKTIPSGKYAKFIVFGHIVSDIAKAWGEICALPLKRTYIADFEEYINVGRDDMRGEIHLYISVE